MTIMNLHPLEDHDPSSESHQVPWSDRIYAMFSHSHVPPMAASHTMQIGS